MKAPVNWKEKKGSFALKTTTSPFSNALTVRRPLYLLDSSKLFFRRTTGGDLYRIWKKEPFGLPS